MSEVVDITPEHNPLPLARDMVMKAEGCVAGAYVLVDREGKLRYDMAGERKVDVLWALQRMSHILMEDY